MGPIFNIFFINKVAVGPINSTVTVPLQCYLSPPYCKTREMKKKKKKKKKKRRRQTQVSAESKQHLSRTSSSDLCSQSILGISGLNIECIFFQSYSMQGGPLKTTVTGVEMFKKILDNGQVSD